MNFAFSTDGRAFGAESHTQRGLRESGRGAEDEISGAEMPLHLPLGEAAPHKMIRNAGTERLQQCETKVPQGYYSGIAACISIGAELP